MSNLIIDNRSKCAVGNLIVNDFSNHGTAEYSIVSIICDFLFQISWHTSTTFPVQYVCLCYMFII